MNKWEAAKTKEGQQNIMKTLLHSDALGENKGAHKSYMLDGL